MRRIGRAGACVVLGTRTTWLSDLPRSTLRLCVSSSLWGVMRRGWLSGRVMYGVSAHREHKLPRTVGSSHTGVKNTLGQIECRTRHASCLGNGWRHQYAPVVLVNHAEKNFMADGMTDNASANRGDVVTPGDPSQ